MNDEDRNTPAHLLRIADLLQRGQISCKNAAKQIEECSAKWSYERSKVMELRAHLLETERRLDPNI